ncbi:antitoxin [Oleiphilus messinensis]|uniref:Antitoxin n=2 Tax=Oleiphilus messinensis TaxID=141451 RepID=A0A1Y0I9T2_9GAMM|nr:antitoxin [Oleiphilus messinensis]
MSALFSRAFMQTHSAKQAALNAIKQLPDNVDYEEIMYRLYVLEQVRQGREDITNGRIISAEELRQEIKSW